MLMFFLGSALAALILWICLSPRIAPFLYNRFLFHPGRERGNPEDLRALARCSDGCEHFFNNGRGHRLHAWFFGQNSSDNFVILYSMGKDGDIARRAETLAQLLDSGAAVFVYEYGGYGVSEGRPSLPGILNDAVAAYDYLTHRLGIREDRVVLYGESLGGAVSAWLVMQRRAAAIILKSAFASLESIAKYRLFFLRLYPSFLFPTPCLDNARAVRVALVPTLIVHGQGDRMIPLSHARFLHESATGPSQLLLLPESRHSFMSDADKVRFRDGIADFIGTLTPAGQVLAHEV